jgi:hypothetical protein
MPKNDALLGGITCLFIDTRAHFIMHGSRAYLYYIFRQSFFWRAREQLALEDTCPWGHDDVPTLLWPLCGCTAVGVVRISVHALMHILEPDPMAGNCPGNGLCCLTGVRATNRVIACSLIYNRNLAYDEVTILD